MLPPQPPEEIAVVGKEPPAHVRIDRPSTHHPDEAHLRFEGPPVGADVDQLRGIVLAGRGTEEEAGADQGPRPVMDELGTLVEKRRVVFIAFHDEIGPLTHIVIAVKVFQDPADHETRIKACCGQEYF